nr:MAG TPA: hypothetical protein [Caudoviricetes sp.]DAX96411.1 MAG TPA: hypothetical protein [Caudoviricetes sp.]
MTRVERRGIYHLHYHFYALKLYGVTHFFE